MEYSLKVIGPTITSFD